MAWQAGRHELTTLVGLDLLGAALVVVEVLLGRHLLVQLLAADRAGAGAGHVLPGALLLAAATAAVAAAGAGAAYYQRLLAELTTRHAQDRVLDVTEAVELIEFEDPDFYDRVARAQAGAQRIPAVITSLSGLLRSAATTGGALVALLILAPVLAPVVLLVLAPAMYAASRRSRLFYRHAYDQTPRDRERGYLERLLTEREAAQEVRAFDLAAFLRRRHRRLCTERIDGLRVVARRILRLTLVADLAGSALAALAVTLLLVATLGHHHSLPTAAAAGATVLFLGRGIASAGGSAAGLSEAALFLGDLLALSPPPPRPAPAHVAAAGAGAGARAGAGAGAGGPPRLPGPIAAEAVSFRYPGACGPALSMVSLRIAPGEIVALVGANGSGKTTLAKVLAGLYRPTDGVVRWAGEDLAAWPASALVGQTAVIFQDFLRYALSARENIGLGRHECADDLAAIRAAAVRAGADEVIAGLDQGYETPLVPIFDGGADLSLGQWQRVALARMVFRDAPFVILDEPTASLDARAEQELFAGIRELLGGRSALLISHRFSTVRTADRIYVLGGGSVVEEGTHAELIAAAGLYADLFARQAAPYR
ncbi:MAG: ATP-binding cassette, subfamily bacterial [Solirubrobacteraceae bacterium]|nr:ATP-binding cassette, subfamily bacterial [Solirubrobacteraceae bacterium]